MDSAYAVCMRQIQQSRAAMASGDVVTKDEIKTLRLQRLIIQLIEPGNGH